MVIDATRPTNPTLRPARAAKLIPPLRYRIDEHGDEVPVPTHPSTIVRWLVDGVRLSDGTRKRLAGARLPSGWVTSAEAIEDFIQALTADRTGDSGQIAPQTSAARRRTAEHTARELDRAGI